MDGAYLTAAWILAAFRVASVGRVTRHDHLGRLIDHVHLVVRDVEASRRFYRV